MCNTHRKTHVMYDIEEQIVKCWDISSDLDLLAEVVNDGSDHTETVKGIKNVYEMRFQRLWNLYEEAVKVNFENRDNNS